MRINYIAEALRTVRARGLSLGQGRVRKPVGPRRVGYKWFEEQASSVGARPVLEQALGFVREGDVFVVTKIDRLPRSIVNLCEIVARVEKRKASLRALAMNLDTGTTTGKLILNVVGSIAEFEREMMLERQREGIAKAKGEGKYKGELRPRGQGGDVVRLAGKGMLREMIADNVGISLASVYRILADARKHDVAALS